MADRTHTYRVRIPDDGRLCVLPVMDLLLFQPLRIVLLRGTGAVSSPPIGEIHAHRSAGTRRACSQMHFLLIEKTKAPPRPR